MFRMLLGQVAEFFGLEFSTTKSSLPTDMENHPPHIILGELRALDRQNKRKTVFNFLSHNYLYFLTYDRSKVSETGKKICTRMIISYSIQLSLNTAY